MSAIPSDARQRLPREPYPGLRPFLDFEAALLFGRERQVHEVIDRLRATQFVAVLGGSGSGKSSLILAGVVPELRSFGIPGAGDLWLPTTCTPGTNVGSDDRAARRHTPITRLVRRFAQRLASRGSAQADAEREQQMAEVFRQESGFARLLDTFGGELAVPPGPDPSEARVLFVIDQFEEIFHPTNQDEPDARLLVERVLDHFFNPHARAFVVLTMRSEHLNDCATYLELPDAINKSSFLVRRLDGDELRDAIIGPAQRFLRLVARADTGGRNLPAQVVFDAPVLARLLRDVRAITHDPDHLPLLQHLLARLWEAALAREEVDVSVPSHITEADLLHAVCTGRGAGEAAPTLDEGVNTLRASVENWPESLYRLHDAAQQQQLDRVLRRLAFKDPNTGLYSQQRIDVDEAAALLGPGRTRADLRALVAEGFLGSVDYLYWDDDDPSRVTLKVSHESFIRGWSRLRRLVDEEFEHFEQFVAVLRKCADWVASARSEDFLLETGELRRLRDSDFERRLVQPGQRETWTRFLKLDRDGVRLGRMLGEFDRFLATSSQRQRERERRQGRQRRSWLMLGALTLVLAPSAMFSIFIQAPVTERAELLFDAGNRANRAALTPDHPGIGAAAPALASLLRAAELIDEARSGQGTLMARISQSLLQGFAWIPPVQRQDAFLRGVAAQAEPPVNGKLRQLLAGALWQGDPPPAPDSGLEPALSISARCEPAGADGVFAEATEAGTLPGLLVVAARRNGNGDAQRALFVPQGPAVRTGTLALHGATYDAGTQRCRYGLPVLAVPLRLQPVLAFDDVLRQVLYSTSGPEVEMPAVTALEIDWERAEDSQRRIVQSRLRSIVTGDPAVQALQRAAGDAPAAVLQGWRVNAGTAMLVDGQSWRTVSSAATRLPALPGDPRFEALAEAADGSPCARLATGWAAQPGFRTQILAGDGHCFVIARGEPPEDGPPRPDGPALEQALVAVYEVPAADQLDRLADNPPAPIASIAPFARVARTDTRWLVGRRGDYAGWLAVQGISRNGQPRLTGAPWSTCALWRLGRELQQRNPAVEAGAPSAETCRGR